MYKKIEKFFRSKNIFPYLLGVYPVLFLYTHNMSFFDFRVLILPIVVIVLFSYLLINTYRRILGKSVKFETLFALTVFYFFSFGHIKTFWSGAGPANNILALLFWMVTMTALLLVIVFLVKNENKISLFLNIVSSFLIGSIILQVTLFRINNIAPVPKNLVDTNVLGITDTGEVTNPNIYYIILDGYGRSDTLQRIYGFDNGYFINRLKELGFYVAEKSRSNYNATALSLPASLNYNYVQDLFKDLNENSWDRNHLRNININNKVFEFLKEKGYYIEHISSGYYSAEIKDINKSIAEHLALGEFEGAIVEMTPVPSIIQLISLGKNDPTTDIHRKTLISAFDNLEKPIVKTNYFIFAHILLPHPPFVFGQNGEEVEYYESLNGWDGSHLLSQGVTKEGYISHYRDQAKFTTDRILEVIEKITKESEYPPVIMLQSDHGPGSMLDWEDYTKSDLDERYGIINAYLLPDRNYEGFYQEVTPVNSFRLVFNSLFGTGFSILEDKSFFSTYSRPYLFTDITDLLSR